MDVMFSVFSLPFVYMKAIVFFVLILYCTTLLTYVIISISFITDSLRVFRHTICLFFIYQ